MVLVPGPTTGIRRRNVYRDFESWQKAHSEWQAQLVPEARSVQYWSGVGVVILSLVLWSAIVGGASHLIARMSVHNTSEGMRRLAIFVGTIATVVWVAFVANGSNGFAGVSAGGWAIFWVGVPMTFVFGFATIWAIDWIVAGFRKDLGR